MKLRRFRSWLLCAAVFAAVMAVAPLRARADNLPTEVWLGGVNVAEEGNNTGNGYSYDPATGTLTLTNYSSNGRWVYDSANNYSASLYVTRGDLKLVLNGLNTLGTNVPGSVLEHGIYLESGLLTISSGEGGTGSLSIKSGYFAIYTAYLNFESGALDCQSMGVCVYASSFNMFGGSLTAESTKNPSGDGEFFGIDSYSLSVVGGKVSGTAGGSNSTGIKASSLFVLGGEVTGKSTSGAGGFGVNATKQLTVTDGVVRGSAANAQKGGIHAGGFDLTKATVTNPTGGRAESGYVADSSGAKALIAEITGHGSCGLYLRESGGKTQYAYTDSSDDGNIWTDYTGDYELTSANCPRYIYTDSGTHSLILNGVTIDEQAAPGIEVFSGSSLTLKLKGTSQVSTQDAESAAILVETGAVLNISDYAGDDGTGSLRVSAKNLGAAIGGDGGIDRAGTGCGTVNIESGAVYAKSVSGAGIGGGGAARGLCGNGGTVTISGGYVKAESALGAGIGGGGCGDPTVSQASEKGGSGGTVTITGGTVTASGGEGKSAGIGGGFGSSGGDGANVVITGGSVLTSGFGGTDARPSIGGGSCAAGLSNVANGAAGTLKNGTGQDAVNVYRTDIYLYTSELKAVDVPAADKEIVMFREGSKITATAYPRVSALSVSRSGAAYAYGTEDMLLVEGRLCVFLPEYSSSLSSQVQGLSEPCLANDSTPVITLNSDTAYPGYMYLRIINVATGSDVGLRIRRLFPEGTYMQYKFEYTEGDEENDLGWIDYGSYAEGSGTVIEVTSSGTAQNVHLIVCSGNHYITFKDLKIENTDAPFIQMKNGGNAGMNITLEGSSSISMTGEGAAIESAWVGVSIGGSGSLDITVSGGGAGIGGGAGMNGGPVAINGGRINITQNGGGAGIGGGAESGGAAGNGGTVRITGGTLTVVRAVPGAGIGGGNGLSAGGNAGSVYISGGSVNAFIGSGAGADGAQTEGTPRSPAAGEPPVFRTAVQLENSSAGARVTALAPSGYGVEDVYTDAEGKVYLWLAEGVELSEAAALQGGASVRYFGSITVDGDNNNSGTLRLPTMPVISEHPQEAGVVAGSSAEFSVSASGLPAPEYQWQVDSGSGFENIEGAIGGVYHTGPAAVGMDGWKYRCIVKNAAGSLTSGSAALTVSAPVLTVTRSPDSGSIFLGNTVTFTAVTDIESPTYVWYETDSLTAEGGTAIGGENGSRLALKTAALGWKTYYCEVTGGAAQDITLTSAPVRINVYYVPDAEPEKPLKNPFRDVFTSDWFYEDVLRAHSLGLINGRTQDAFEPGGTLTVAEAVKLAACAHQYLNTGKVTLKNSEENPWYGAYLDYCIEEGIAEAGLLPEDLNEPVTRGLLAQIFAGVLPESYTVKNGASAGDLPEADASPYKDAVYKLYRAGVMIGRLDGGETELALSESMLRSEVAALICRLALPASRKAV